MPLMEQRAEGQALVENQELLFLDMLYEQNIIGGGDIAMDANVELRLRQRQRLRLRGTLNRT